MKCDIWGQVTHPTRDCPMKRDGWKEELSNEDDLNEFLDNLKSKKLKMIENSNEEEKDKTIKDNAFNDVTKKVVSEIEKEAPGSVPKEVKQKVQPYTKKEDAQDKLSDRVVALIDENNKIALNGTLLSSNVLNPLQSLHSNFKDNYGKLLANQAVNFYKNYVQPRMSQPPNQYNHYMPPPYPGTQMPRPSPYPPAAPYPPPQGYQPYPAGYPYPPYQYPPQSYNPGFIPNKVLNKY